MKVDPASLSPREKHDFFASVIVPRPIAFVSTVDEKGRFNAAPYSAFARLVMNPPIVFLAVGRRGIREKDTARNIAAVGDFVINMVDDNLAQAMNQASTSYPPDVDEIKETGLTALKSDKVKSPRIAEAPLSLECRLMQTLEFGDSRRRGTIFLGEVVLVHLKDEIITNGKIDPLKAKIIGRLGETDLYCRTTDIFRMKRPD